MAQSPTKSYIFHHCASKQVGVLQDDAQGAAKAGFPDFVDIDAVIADFAVLNIVEAIEQGRIIERGTHDQLIEEKGHPPT